jgi:hypothetical protein
VKKLNSVAMVGTGPLHTRTKIVGVATTTNWEPKKYVSKIRTIRLRPHAKAKALRVPVGTRV